MGVANSVTGVIVTPTATDSRAAITVNGTAVTVRVTAEDTSTSKIYRIIVGRGVTGQYGWKATDDLNSLFAALNSYATGIWSNGTTMWVVKGGEKVYHCGGGIRLHLHDEKGLNSEPDGVRSGAGVRRSGLSQESSGSSEIWWAVLCQLSTALRALR